ncbi:response regulator transcription factor [Mucilaginibacter flavidus]|jgi:DNA-binding NarL/FixJ family response regulator|uniref:response regulator transcription factor n=1 Tax=Mucilaginibacter flavidus TaxID=2949309 RepID=UPI0020929B93|nr:response regulator transcription factor [Mucilaginibacter flavidus]MCO5946340.1 response regulator transcription factor [Mucilaginibacter flavidus]
MSVRIALVDDKRIIRNTLAEQISYYKEITVVFQANDGSEFLENMKALAADMRPQVVLMDIEMPVMDGIEAVTIAKEVYPDTHFLMLTVFDDDEKLFEAIKAGATGYLLKDEKVSSIVKAITEIVFEGGVPMSPRIARKVLGLLRNSPDDAAPAAENEEEAHTLSTRELEILNRIVDGLNYQQIGERLFISPHTVRKHIANIYEKLHVSNKASAIKIAIRKKWFS